MYTKICLNNWHSDVLKVSWDDNTCNLIHKKCYLRKLLQRYLTPYNTKCNIQRSNQQMATLIIPCTACSYLELRKGNNVSLLSSIFTNKRPVDCGYWNPNASYGTQSQGSWTQHISSAKWMLPWLLLGKNFTFSLNSYSHTHWLGWISGVNMHTTALLLPIMM